MGTPRYAFRRFSAALALCATAFALPAFAQEADPEAGEPVPGQIVVEGELPDGGVAVRRQARDITQNIGSTSKPLARFRRPICPGVWGLAPENAELVINRIYDNAERAGLEVDTAEGCAANVWVIVVDDPAATWQQLRDENGWMVRDLGRSERNAVEDQEGPVRSWSISTTRTHGGQVVQTGFDAVAGNMLGRQNGNAGGAPVVPTTSMSRTETAIRRDLEMSVVMIARSALADRDAFAIADYATMRSLAQTEEPSQEGAYDTILTLFQDEYSPDRLSAFDISYLRSLYEGTGFRAATRSLTSLDEHMAEELLREE